MAQELSDKIRAAAQAKGIDPEIALRIARAESSNNPAAQAKTSSAGGLFQVVDRTWKEFGGAPGKKFDPDENIRVGTDIIASNTNSLKKFLNRDPRPAEVYAAHYFGFAGAKPFLTAEPGTPMESLLSKDAIKANPNLKGKTSDQIMATLEKKMGGTPTPTVSRETSAPVPREPLPPSLPPMAAAPEEAAPVAAPSTSKMADLGPSYQAALALSFLADTDEKEDRDIDREPGIAEKYLAEMDAAPRPSALAGFSDISIKSPFAEPPKPQLLADGGSVQRLAGGGLPFVPTAMVRPSARRELEAIKASFDQYNNQVDSYQKQADAYAASVDAYNANAQATDFTDVEPVVPTAPGVTPEQYAALGEKAKKDMSNRNMALQVAADPERFGFNMNRMFAEGGEVEEESFPDAGRPTVQEEYMAKAMFPDMPVAEAVYLLRGGQRQSTSMGEMLSGNIGAQIPLGKDASAMLMLAGSRPERSNSESKALMAAFNKRVGDEGGLDINVVRPLDAPPGIFAGGLSASYPLGEGRISGNVNALKLPGQDPRITGYGVGYGGRVGPGNLSAGIMKQKDGPYSGQVEYRLPIGRADGSLEEGEVKRLTPQQIEQMSAREALEREKASSAAFLTPKSGIGRKISTKPGELEAAALQGVTETPYNLFGAPVDLATMAMRPFGYDVEKPMFGSEDLKQRALAAGIRQKPPESAAARALYELTQAGSGLVNPAAPVRGAVAAAEKTGEAAKMLARDFQQYNRQLDVPGASYAVRNKGTPFVMAYGDTPGPDGALPSMDQAEKYVRELATTNDQPLNEWFSNKVTPYLRRDFASPEDQFVQAADKNMLLHFAQKPTKRDAPESASQYDRRKNLEGTRKIEGFPEEGVATTPYGKRVEALTDASAWPAWLEDISSPGLVPPSMRGMVDTNPSARVTELGSNIDKKLKFEDLRDGMQEMRRLGPEYSAYGQAPIKVPKEYLLTDESLIGLTPAQASNRVATFRNWRDDNRQRMAARFAKEDPRLPREQLPGEMTAVALPDLQSSPDVKQLAMDVGCDGGWCTKDQSNALSYGSGDNRLHIVLDAKARPMAQITLTRLPPTKRQLEADPSAPDRYSVTELLGKDNSSDFSKNPALPAIQQYVKSLDRRNGLAFMTNLDKIDMKELSGADLVKGAKKLSDLRQRYQPGISPEDYMAATQRDIIDFETAVYGLNGGSKYLTKDQDVNLLFQQALDKLAPQQRATGGMIERQSTDNRRYL